MTFGRELILLALFLGLAGCLDTGRATPHPSRPADARRGEYLVRAANCAGCHTDKEHGGAKFAGGGSVPTPFGSYFSRNITPDPVHGIGAWSDADFLTAMRKGIAPDGSRYFPAFPFTSFSGMADQDVLDMKAYLFTQAPEAAVNKPHDVMFPFDVRANLGIWRSLYFIEGPMLPIPNKSADWNRGAYLVEAVAHCGECHTPRNMMGARDQDKAFSGARLVGQKTPIAPNITQDAHDGIGKWSVEEIADFLKTGLTPEGDIAGAPMSEVVDEGTSHLSDGDRRAMAIYLKSVPALAGNPK